MWGTHTYEVGMIDEPVRQLPGDEIDEELDEEWIRETDEPEVRNVGANKSPEDGWQVSIWAAEFVREEPLESRMRTTVTEHLRSVAGVTGVWEEDREEWHVEGSPNGDELVRAAAAAVESLAVEIREHVSRL
jgi:hypothetical protein